MKPNDYTDVTRKLEEKYAERNLKWNYLGGSHPLQGTGDMDGMLMYFRFRYDFVSLELGVIDEEFRRIADSNSRIQGRRSYKAALKAVEAGEPNAAIDLEWAKMLMGKSMWDDSYPDRKLVYASSGPVTGDKYAGEMTPDEFYSAFVELVEKLKPLPEEYQIRYPVEMREEDSEEG